MFRNNQQNPYGQAKDRAKNAAAKAGKGVVAVIVIIFAVYLLFGSIYSLKENEYAVVTTFGVPKVVEQSGIHLKIPFVQELEKVPKTINGFPIGYRADTDESVDSESFMITRDYYFVNVDFYVEYKVTDPVKYLYASESPVDILKMLTQSYIRDTIGLYDVDSVITTGKNEIQASIKEKIVGRLEQEDIGVQLVNITIQDAEPPTQEVIEAFKAVETAKQKAETVINDAKAYQNAQLPKAQAQADQLVQNAEYLKQKRINEAVEQVAMFNAMYAEYANNPQLTRSRMYYEAISEVLPGVKLFVNTGTGSGSDVQMLLPLDALLAPTGGND